jgi:single-stranded-DNA-specific exonuclease
LSGVDLGSAIAQAREDGLLTGGGGHAMAAGLTIDRAKLDAFAVWLERKLARDVRLALDNAELAIDAVVSPLAVTAAFANDVAAAGPFGAGNPEPVFMLSDMSVVSCRRVGAGHIACQLSNLSGQMASAIAFRADDEPLGALLQSGVRLHIAGKIRADDWRGGNAGQFQIVDAAPAEFS